MMLSNKHLWSGFAVWSAIAISLSICSQASAAETKAGVAAVINKQVVGSLRGTEITLSPGSDVFVDQIVRTGDASAAQLRLLDSTSLSIGPDSEVTLDQFVYSGNRGTGTVVFNLGKGVFRFISGTQQPTSYQIKTKIATIGVRGTIIEVQVTDDWMTLLLKSGLSTATMPGGRVERLSVPGTAVTIHANGQVEGPRPWSGKISLFDSVAGDVTGSVTTFGAATGAGGQLITTGAFSTLTGLSQNRAPTTNTPPLDPPPFQGPAFTTTTSPVTAVRAVSP